jgi:hypothetical protein
MLQDRDIASNLTHIGVVESLRFRWIVSIGDRAVGLWLAREAAATSGRMDLFPMPFMTTSTPYRPVTTGGAAVAAPGEFPLDGWSYAMPWVR